MTRIRPQRGGEAPQTAQCPANALCKSCKTSDLNEVVLRGRSTFRDIADNARKGEPLSCGFVTDYEMMSGVYGLIQALLLSALKGREVMQTTPCAFVSGNLS